MLKKTSGPNVANNQPSLVQNNSGSGDAATNKNNVNKNIKQQKVPLPVKKDCKIIKVRAHLLR